MDKEQQKDLQSIDAFGILNLQVREKLDALGDYANLEFHIKLEKHDGIITDAYLGQRTENGFVATEHFRKM